MNCLEKMKETKWTRMVEDMVAENPLVFHGSRGMNHVRSGIILKPTIENEGYQLTLQFAQGQYDNFAAVITRHTHLGLELAYPEDVYYFSRLCLLGAAHGRRKLYQDCEMLYAMTDDTVSMEVLSFLDKYSLNYGEDANLWYNVMVQIYYGMIAEEHFARIWSPNSLPKRTIIGKMMKMHAIHRVLIEMDDIKAAATECENMQPQQIQQQAAQMGIVRHITWKPYSDKLDEAVYLPVTVAK